MTSHYGGYRQSLIVEVGGSVFGTANVFSRHERMMRLYEEVCEFMRAGAKELGMSDAELTDMMRKVEAYEFSRPVGHVGQEIAGIGVCLYGASEAFGHDCEGVIDNEVLRIIRKAPELREKHRNKPAAVRALSNEQEKVA
jgi:hypothetical protein